MPHLSTDVLIIGGGVAGLWMLDHLRRLDRPALLIERFALGHGQTVTSQGIIHGGLKYTLTGRMSESAKAIRDMPALWRDCLAGRAEPDLSGTRLRSDYCYLWRTGSIRSRLGMVGARVGLRTRPTAVPKSDWPDVFAQCGDLMRVDEQVLAPDSLLDVLARPHRQRLLAAEAITIAPDGQRVSIRHGGREQEIQAGAVVLCAGEGNQSLREMAGLSPTLMQRRPLHMVMARGPLPTVNGHCTDGARTRLTITTDRDAAGRTVWQLGGQVAEDGVAMDAHVLVAHARREVAQVLPGVDLAGVEWATYRVDRAEARTPDGRRPEQAFARREGRIVTAWPTKLVLAPHLAQMVTNLLDTPTSADDLPDDWPRPRVAPPPWETAAWMGDA